MIRTRQGTRPIETEGYRRKRRWAILLLGLCSALLMIGYAFNYFLEPYDRVLAVPTGGRLVVLSQPRAFQGDEEIYERWRKPESKDWEEPERLYGSFLAAAALGDDLLVVHEESASLASEGKSSRVIPLDAQFVASAAVGAPGAVGEAWVFGIRGTRKVACARVGEKGWEELPPDLWTRAAKSGVKAVPAPWGAWVAWREAQESSGPCLRVARREADGWKPCEERIEYIHGDSLFALCGAGEDAWLIYAAKRMVGRGELTFLARKLTKQGIGAEEEIAVADPLRVKREVLGIAVARFEGAMWLVAGRMGGVHVARMKAEPERGYQASFSDPDGRLARARGLAWAWVGSLMAVALLLTGMGVALLRERRYVEGTAAPAPSAPLPSATLAQRGVAYAIDFLLLAPIGFLFQAFVFQDATSSLDPTRIEFFLRPGFLVSLGLFHLVTAVYYTLCEANSGQSVGKWVVGIEVTDVSGNPITLRQAAVRNLVRLVDAGYVFLFFIGMFSILVTARGQRVGDLAAGTVVVQRLAAEEEDEEEPEEGE